MERLSANRYSLLTLQCLYVGPKNEKHICHNMMLVGRTNINMLLMISRSCCKQTTIREYCWSSSEVIVWFLISDELLFEVALQLYWQLLFILSPGSSAFHNGYAFFSILAYILASIPMRHDCSLTCSTVFAQHSSHHALPHFSHIYNRFGRALLQQVQGIPFSRGIRFTECLKTE
jgi:hypothetical protein